MKKPIHMICVFKKRQYASFFEYDIMEERIDAKKKYGRKKKWTNW